MTSFNWGLCSHHQPMRHKKIKFSKILYINDWLFRHPVQPPCTIFILFLGAMWLNVKGTLCPIFSSPHVEPPSIPAIPFLSPLWLDSSCMCLPSKILNLFFFSGVVFVQHDHICIDTLLLPLQTLHLRNFKEEKMKYFLNCAKFSLQERKHYETKVVEEYCWAITWATEQ